MKAKIKTLALAVTLAFMGAAYGQTSNSTSGAGAQTTTTANPVNNNLGSGASTSSSGSQAGAVSSTTGNNVGMGVSVQQDFSQPGEQHQYLEYGGTHTINTNVSGTTTLRNVPNVVPPNILPTSPCMGSSSLGGSVAGFGIGGGTSWKDSDCGYRETARVFMQANRMEDGLAVLCASEYAAAAPTCKNLAKKAEAEQRQQAAAASGYGANQRVASSGASQDVMRTMNDSGRNGLVNGTMSKSEYDRQITLAAMQPTEAERKAANCRVALAAGDTILAGRFGCAPVAAGK